MFGFVKKVFFTGLTILSNFTRTNSLSGISMNNKSVKQDYKLLMLMEMILCFLHLVLKQVNVVVVIIISIIRIKKFVFLML